MLLAVVPFLLTSRETLAPPHAECLLILLEFPHRADPHGAGAGSCSLKKTGVCSDSVQELSLGDIEGRGQGATQAPYCCFVCV